MSDMIKYTCPAIFSTTAIVTATAFAFWCQSFVFEGNSFSMKVGPLQQTTVSFDIPDLHLSPWYKRETTIDSTSLSQSSNGEWTFAVNTHDECVTYGSDLDSKWTFVRVVTVITFVLGFLSTLAVCLAPCTGRFTAKLWNGVAVIFILVLTLFQGLTFLMLRSNACSENPVVRELSDNIQDTLNKAGLSTSNNIQFGQRDLFWDNDCSWDAGSSANVVAIVCWFLAGAVMLAVGPPADLMAPTTKQNPAQEQARPRATAEAQPVSLSDELL